VTPDVYRVEHARINSYLIDAADGVVLVDAGLPSAAGAILDRLRAIGREPSDVRAILVTHAHLDHAGGLAALKKATGATVYMHRLDAGLVRAGRARRDWSPAPGFINEVIFRVLDAAPDRLEPADVAGEVEDGDIVPAAGGIQALHVPGHSAGHIAYLWPEHGGVLFVGDAASHEMGLRQGANWEDVEEGMCSLRRLAALDFDIACFAHGRPIVGGASDRFRAVWGTD
jgi:glyoxylase-like metal-dependent hydrolase (beta-lactamase superfamily II)